MIFAGTARSQSPGQPRPDGPPPSRPMAERLKHRLEELRRDGKQEEAERLERRVREMRERLREKPQGERRGESRRGTPAVSAGEREGHLAEAAKHLRAAGINVSPEMLERLAHASAGRMKSGHQSSWGPSRWGRTDSAGGRPSFAPKAGAEFGGGPRLNAMHRRSDRSSGRPEVPPMGKMAPGAGWPMDAMHNEIRMLVKQVEELRAMMQERGGEAARPPQGQGPEMRRPNIGESRAEGPQTGPRWNRSPDPAVPRDRRDAPARTPGWNGPRGEAGPSHSPGNLPPPPDRPRGDAPSPPPDR